MTHLCRYENGYFVVLYVLKISAIRYIESNLVTFYISVENDQSFLNVYSSLILFCSYDGRIRFQLVASNGVNGIMDRIQSKKQREKHLVSFIPPKRLS